MAKPGYIKLLKECARNTPVVGIMPLLGNVRSRKIVQEIADRRWNPFITEQSGKLDHMIKHLTILQVVLSGVYKEAKTLSPAILGLLAEMLHIYDATFAHPLRPDQPIADMDADDKAWFFPQWPVVQTLSRYEIDGKDKDDGDMCVKNKLYHPVLSPGIIAYLCRHGVCYGFNIMSKPESPRMPFELFVTRWPTPPRRIVYDNACRLHLYCLNREPTFFKMSHFLVDRFNMLGHTGCSKSYDMAKYAASADISKINLECCEQLNSILVKLKLSLSYMTFARVAAIEKVEEDGSAVVAARPAIVVHLRLDVMGDLHFQHLVAVVIILQPR
uniref:Uncharacterized protein n=1 Tax=Plectus sambesii TaxID=2011161 RepID=A0A914WKG2_9BILA